MDKEAIDAYKRAIRINPDYADAHNNLGGATTKKLPGESLADYTLQGDAGYVVMMLERIIDDTCEQREFVNTEIIEYPENPGKDPWTERWTIDRCGELVYYKVEFTPSPSGGTDFGCVCLEVTSCKFSIDGCTKGKIRVKPNLLTRNKT